jgi:hypothetical protein
MIGRVLETAVKSDSFIDFGDEIYVRDVLADFTGKLADVYPQPLWLVQTWFYVPNV